MMIATLLRPVRDSDHRTPRGTGLALERFGTRFLVGARTHAQERGVSPDLHCRFWFGFLGGGGL